MVDPDVVGDVLDMIGRVAAVLGAAVLALGLLAHPVERWSVGPDNWLVLAPFTALTGSVLLLAGVALLVLLDPEEMLRLPTDDDEIERLAARAALWVSTAVAGNEADVILDDGVLALLPLMGLLAGLLLGVTWLLKALDRAALLWSTRDYDADASEVEP